MNTTEFQKLCSEMNEKYNTNQMTDADVDIFADLISNVLSREDLRGEGTSYREFADNISYKYEKDIQMNPLLARLYEICRMYDNFRERPLTETEAKSLLNEKTTDKHKHPILISVYDGHRQLANCWWENVSNTAGSAAKVAQIVDDMPYLDDTSEPTDNIENIELLTKIAAAFSKGEAGFDPVDVENAERFGEDRPLAMDRKSGIIEVMTGLDRNRKRGGASVKLDLRKRTVYMDDFLMYGVEFYRELTDDASFTTSSLPIIEGNKIDYTFDTARAAADYWDKMPAAFGIPGNTNLVGSQMRVEPAEQKSEVA